MEFNRPVNEISFSRMWRGSTALVLALFLLSACATKPYQYESTLSFPVTDRVIVQSENGLTVSTSVPTEDETRRLFGVPLYNRGIQPVWIKVENQSDEHVRFALSSIDRDYFSPLEVAYIHKKGFSKKARTDMERRFYETGMPRHIPAGETRSGYVFTHASPGTKSFNVDLYGNGSDHNFAFFVTVPGFVPDHQEVNFKNLYSHDELLNYDLSGFRNALMEQQWTTYSETGQPGLPISLVIVGNGLDTLKALLRAGWYEQPSVREIADKSKAHFMFGRLPDASFGIKRSDKSERNELYLWQSPIRVNGMPVWMARVTHFIGQKTQIQQVLFGARIDPDLDEGRNYFMQNMWYSQCLDQLAWQKIIDPITVEERRTDFAGTEYFTDGYMVIAWLSGDPVSLVDTKRVNWDTAPHFQ